MLLSRLHSYFAFDGIVLRWFSSYLRGRSQTVSVNGITSSPRNLMYGVPQGSILGRLLFMFFIASLQDIISSYNLRSMFYADDTQLYISVKPSSENMALDFLLDSVSAVFDWNTQNKLQTNLGKTDVLHLTSRFVRNPPLGNLLRLANVSVVPTHKVRNLSVTIDRNCIFSCHVHICKKAFHSVIKTSDEK